MSTGSGSSRAPPATWSAATKWHSACRPLASRLQQLADGNFIGRADDVIGEATGRQLGNAFRWRYTLSLPVDGKVIEVQMDDWMYLLSERVMLNKASMSKFGVHLGEVTLSFTKR